MRFKIMRNPKHVVFSNTNRITPCLRLSNISNRSITLCLTNPIRNFVFSL